MGQPVESADRFQHPDVLGAGPLEQHGDAPAFELGDDLAKRLRPGGVEHLQVGEPQDRDLGGGHGRQLGEEALGGAEEQGAVESVGDDALVEESAGAGRLVVRCVDGLGGGAGREGHLAQGEHRAAAAIPISTARMRSKATVATAVSARTAASERVERRTARTLCISTIGGR